MSRCFLVLLAIIFFVPYVGGQQTEQQKNTWFSLVYKKKFEKQFEFNIDGGSRFCSDFLKMNRQNFIRVLVEKKYNHFGVGVGYALFDTYNFKSKDFILENRPFFQAKYDKELKKNYSLFARFRSEFRIYENQPTAVYRNRIQIGVEKKINKWVNPRINYEFFYSNTATNHTEQRYTLGNVFINDKIKFNLFYTLQLQESLRQNSKQVKQHILGIQLQL